MTSFQPELWVAHPGAAVDFYRRAFDATVLMRVGDGDGAIAQLAVGDAAFWVVSADTALARLDPLDVAGRTGRTLIVVDDPDAFHARAVAAGATQTSPVADEHGWRVGRIIDPHGHEWEIGKPLGEWPPPRTGGQD